MNFTDILSIFFIFGKLFSFIIVLIIIRNSKSLNKDIPWIVFILLFPFIGSLMYLFFRSDILNSNLLKDISKSIQESKKYFVQNEEVREEVLNDNNAPMVYLLNHCNFPITKNNRCVYYPSGEIFFDNVKAELRNAKHFIFIEFFSIEIGTLWKEILEILKEKVQEGIEVRIIYDNTACNKKITYKYYKKLEYSGIKCEPYYKNYPLIGAIRDHREHRKCVIVDGKIAFTGGMNIEDRYVNLEQPYGYWKDVGISVQGEGVWNFTVMFLSMWNALREEEEDYTKYKDNSLTRFKNLGYVVSFGDNPLDQENVVKNVYISMIHQAKKYLYIFTPYLVLDMDIYNALSLAGKRGVDVKIVIPGIPDKRIVYQVSLLNARKLIEDKVKVYTYTPGFMHGKVFLADDKMAMVGTTNTDYRSLYLDFEYSVLMKDVAIIKDIKKDVEETFQQSVEVKPLKTNVFQFLWEAILQLFAPFM